MKKVFNYLLIVTLLIGTAVSFGSCKDDDEDEKTGGYSIVGTWKHTFSTGYVLWTFNSNGTCVWSEKYYGYEEISLTDYGTYTYKDGALIVYMGDEREVWNLSWVDKNHFIDDDGNHWDRQ